MKGKIKIALAGIIMAVSSTVFAQCDDSTCVGNVPLYNQPLQNTYSQQLVFNQTPTTVSYNYMTSACPAGYQGANGQAGYIIDRQTVLTYSNGTVSVSDWVEYEDNCVENPPSPPAPSVPLCNEFKGNLTSWVGAASSVNSTVANIANIPASQCASIPGYLANQLLSENPAYGNWCMGVQQGGSGALPSWVTVKEYKTASCYSTSYTFIIYK